MAKAPDKKAVVSQIINNYYSCNNLNAKAENPSGPVGLLINSLEEIGACLTKDFTITTEGEVDIDIWNLPWQHLNKHPRKDGKP